MEQFAGKYIMSLDQGTTSSRCIIYDRKGSIIASAQKEFTQFFPKEGWVEHEAEEIYDSQMEVAKRALVKADLTWQNIAAIGITNQRETTILWDRKTGKPVYRAIVWQCRRTAEYCDELAANQELIDDIRNRTGLLLDPYFSATKIHWILENVPGARERAEAGELAFGTVETWLIWKMTGGKVHVTDYSNASRTMLFNIHTLTWDRDIMELLGIPEAILPEAVPCSKVYGTTIPELFGGEIPIAGAAGDQQAALFGQGCFEPGEAKSTYGTGNFLLMNTGETPVTSENGLLTTIAWGLDGKVNYALEGSVFVCGAAMQWLRDELDILKDSAESERMALSVPDSAGLYVVPAFTGLGAPYWDPYARGTVFGITRGAGKNHLVRATLESMAYQCYDLLSAMSRDRGADLPSLKVDGGASANNYLMQFQADILDCDVVRPRSVETTSLGAAYLAGLAVGYWDGLADILENAAVDRVFHPSMDPEQREKLLNGWKEAVKRALGWAKAI